MFRAVASRLNYLAQDRPDLMCATTKLCSKMSLAQSRKSVRRCMILDGEAMRSGKLTVETISVEANFSGFGTKHLTN